jgi:hypothetical protein
MIEFSKIGKLKNKMTKFFDNQGKEEEVNVMEKARRESRARTAQRRIPTNYRASDLRKKEIGINEFIESEIERANRNNIDDVQFLVMRHLEEGYPLPEWMEIKIKKNMTRCGLRRGEILADMARSVLSSAQIAKSARRQSVAEQTQFNYLRNFRGINLTKLPTNGPGSIRLHNGEFLRDSYHRPPEATKTLDAVYGSDYVYIKHVNESGGAQDNQVEDGLNFVI